MSVRASSVRKAQKDAGPRPKRGSPDDTRSRLVMAAAREIEQHGYFGTDTNRIARAAGYAPGTFYKHFEDKRAIFIAVYEEWVTQEWADIGAIIKERKSTDQTAAAIADAVIAHHRAWPGFRASLRALVALDPIVRKAHRRWRRKQLLAMRRLGNRIEPTQAILLLLAERIGDALADGEAASLGLRDEIARNYLVERIAELLRHP